jgi:hypothetical protein
MSSEELTRKKKRMAKRKVWRCFHCDEVFRSRKSAYLHFGPDDACEYDVPACVDPLRHDESKRLNELRAAQEYALDRDRAANELEDDLDESNRELDEIRKLTGCHTLHDLRMWMDSQQGRVVTANALIDGFREAAPELAARIIG